MHRKYFILLISMLLMPACNGGKGYKELTATQVLGSPYFMISYRNYSMPYSEAKETIAKAMKGVTVEIYFGDWDRNSGNFVGPFIKILRTFNYDENKARFYNVDEEKLIRAQIEQEKQLLLYPTFIFFKKNKEIGRLIEGSQHNIDDLADDIIKLLTKK